MAKWHSLVDVSTLPPSKKSCLTDWKICILCQKDTKAGLEYPAIPHECMLLDLDIKRLDDGDGIKLQ